MRIFLIVLTIIAALLIGFLLRRTVTRRLKLTVLDGWIVQTIGVISTLPPLILAAIIVPSIWDSNLSFSLWHQLTAQIHIQDVTAFSWSLVETLLIMVLGIGIARTTMKVTVRGLGENRIDINIRTLIGRILYILVLIIATFWILSIWQISIGLPVAVIGTLTVAFTFAIQDILKDLVAGFYILMERPFHIGDQISVCNNISTVTYTGKVEDVQLRATRLRLTSGEQITIPNALVFGGIVINNTYYGERRVTILVTMPLEEFNYETTPDQILSILKGLDTVMTKPEPIVSLKAYNDKHATLNVRFWMAHADVITLSKTLVTMHTSLPNSDLTVSESGGDI